MPRLYHRPFATIGLIVVNVLVVYLMFPTALYQDWTLVLGDGIHPLAVGDEPVPAFGHMARCRQYDLPLDVRACRRGEARGW